MMKISNPILFGHAFTVFFQDVLYSELAEKFTPIDDEIKVKRSTIISLIYFGI